MSKSKRIKKKHEQEEIDNKKTEVLANIINDSKLSRKDRFKIWKYKIFHRGKVENIALELYSVNLFFEPHWFREKAYQTYAEDRFLGNMADFHLLMMTKCNMNDLNWENYYNRKGELLTTEEF